MCVWPGRSITGTGLAGPRGESQEVLREAPGGETQKAGGAEAEGGEEEDGGGGEAQTETQRGAGEELMTYRLP